MQTKYKVINWSKAVAKTNENLDFFTLASTPNDETCTQAGMDLESQIKECTALINQLKRGAGTPDEGAEFFIIENTGHDFGIYYEAGIFYQPTPDTDEAEESQSEIYAMIIEQNIPEQWDNEAKEELRKAGHPAHQPGKIIKMNAA